MIVFVCILIFILLVIIIVSCSYIEINLEDITIDKYEKIEKILKTLLYEKDKNKFNALDYISFKLKIRILFMDKIPIIVIKKNNYQIKEIIKKQYYKEMKKTKKQINKDKKEAKKIVKMIIKNIDLKQTELNMTIGTEDAAFTAIVSSIITIAIAITHPHITKLEKNEKFSYNIKPIYLDQNVFFLQFSGILALKIIHIMNGIICKKEEKIKYE